MATPKMERTRYSGIYKRGGRYVVVWRYRGKQHKSFHGSLAEAREAKAQRQAGDRRPVSKVGFEDYFTDWIESYAGRTSRGFSETTRPVYRRPIAKHAVPRWRTWRLADVEPADVRELFGEMHKGGSSTSAIRKLRAALSAMFATAVEDGQLRSNPIRGVRIPSALAENDGLDKSKAKALTRTELALLIAALPMEWRLFFEFLTHTGLRISEATGLTWAHLDLGERPRVKVREQVYQRERRRLKSSQSRRDIPLSPGMAVRLLGLRRDSYAGEDGPVFASHAGSELMPSNVSRRVLKPAARRVGFGWVSFHTFRHTCASLLFAAGRNVKQVQEWLGHSDPGFTLRTYVHLMDEGIGDATFFDRIIGEGGNGWATQHPETTAKPLVPSPAGTEG
jgi:integrase